jgi:hypothetical protein
MSPIKPFKAVRVGIFDPATGELEEAEPMNDDYPDEGEQPSEEWLAGYRQGQAEARADLAARLREARFEPPDNICARCHHDGGDHDLGNWCLICPRPDVPARPIEGRLAAGWCYFSSMTEDERWTFGLARLAEEAAHVWVGDRGVATGDNIPAPPAPLDVALAEVRAEYLRAIAQHPVELLAKEFWDHVCADTGSRREARHEAAQVAAMAVRYMLDVARLTEADHG